MGSLGPPSEPPLGAGARPPGVATGDPAGLGDHLPRCRGRAPLLLFLRRRGHRGERLRGGAGRGEEACAQYPLSAQVRGRLAPFALFPPPRHGASLHPADGPSGAGRRRAARGSRGLPPTPASCSTKKQDIRFPSSARNSVAVAGPLRSPPGLSEAALEFVASAEYFAVLAT